ncbi:LamG-like jellyroll fold domain-containing protein, partial [candidate division KSB1 bacterium]
NLLGADTSWFSNSRDFSVSVWIKSDKSIADTTIIVSNADFSTEDMGIYGKRRTNKGFTLYSYDGGWGWNIGNGRLHYLYEPIAEDQSVTDNKWHHIVFTHSAEKKEIRLYYDGINKAVLHIGDMDERDFISELPLCLGSDGNLSSEYPAFQGKIDELYVWCSVLSSKQINNDFEKYSTAEDEPELKNDIITVVNWNIWHGGTHFTIEKDGFDGVDRIIELIRKSEADIVLMQETYGAGSRISSTLGFYYYEAASTVGAVWGANLSVMSRFPIEDAYMVEARGNYGNNYAFNNGGIKIRLSENRSIIVFSNWYNGSKPEDLEAVLQYWTPLIDGSDKIPIIFGGDFNSISHFDDRKGESGHSKLMTGAGFIDAYRTLNPDVSLYPGYSNGGFSSRIDYVYFKGKNIEELSAEPIVQNFRGKEDRTPGYPSDHLGVVVKFKLK